MSFVTHLETALDGTRFPAGQVRRCIRAGRCGCATTWTRAGGALRRSNRGARSLPMALSRIAAVTVRRRAGHAGRGYDAVVAVPALGPGDGTAASFHQRRIAVADRQLQEPRHDDGREHGSTSRPASLGDSDGRQRRRALAAYGARAGMEVYVFMPEDTPIINQMEAHLAGARVFLVNGLITDCGRLVREGTERMGWFDVSTLKEPYRLEGKKTMGLELAEQLGWRLPDVILYPTGGGTGLIGMAKAFQELRELGWLQTEKSPRLIACQSDGCAPIVRAFETGARFAEPFPNAHTIASGLRVPAAVGDFMMLDAIRASGGCAVAGREERVLYWMRKAAGLEGVSLCPEAAICLDCLESLCAAGAVQPDEEVIVFNTGASQKYPETVPLSLPRWIRIGPLFMNHCRNRR